MQRLKRSLQFAAFAAIPALLVTACTDNPAGNDDGPSDPEVEVHRIEDLHAPYDRTSEENDYVLFSLKSGQVVQAADADGFNWDIGFSGTRIILNGGVNGEGQAGAVLLDVPFDEVQIAPAEGYETDTVEANAIAGWYNYTGQTGSPVHAILAKEEQTIVIRTADGKHYGKVQILSYYKGNPDPSSEEFANLQTRPAEQYFTFRYAIQLAEGVRELK